MSRDKQIKGMQNALIKIAKQPTMIDGLEHWSDAIAEALYNAGYRKASDVAMEIINHIDAWFMYCEKYSGHLIKSRLAELKKKYESEGAE